MFVFIFVFFGMFSVLLVNMPTEFIEVEVGASVQDKEAADFFNAQNITMYNHTLSIDLTYGESNQSDFGLPEGQKLEFWWDYYVSWPNRDLFQLRHLTDNLWGWWWGWHLLGMTEPFWSRTSLKSGIGLDRAGLLELFDEDKNYTYCEWYCDHLNVKLFILTANQSWTLEESWNNHKLKLYTSYDIDWTATGTSMWHIMGQLLSFQNPDLGVPGIGGAILGTGLSLTLWASIAILFFAFITAVIPFIGGWGKG